ncbi:RagB/SusD family nutrient uptake outer membrane protein, partial [Candidatus Dojkabacteria bacterium]|nr:RagB/SusD family nutrient uptake outer membrane protein [Candidatus Dojkabacteria bacterium]
MKKVILYILISVSALFLTTCTDDFLEIQPLDRVSAEQLFETPAGIKTVLATIYNIMPMEDFNYEPARGFNFHESLRATTNSHGGWSIDSYTDHVCLDSHGGGTPGRALVGYWDYTSVRRVNQFLKTLDELTTLDDTEKKILIGEAHFVRAYIYLTLARRYGGVPLITEVQDMDPNDISPLFVPRSTEKETWDFILSECDLAIENLPTTATDGPLRATKWAGYALKSRAALHAASLAKYWDRAPLTGEAVDKKLVGGMTIADANNYYLACINASKEIIDNSGKELYKPEPADRAEAAKNFQTMFETPEAADIEVIFKKGYIDGIPTELQGHSTDTYFLVQQLKIRDYYMLGRYGVTLDLVDLFEDYTDDGTGKSSPVKTRSDGVENEYAPNALSMDISKPYLLYDNQLEPFVDKDARLHGSVMLPGTTFKGVLINMQGGLIEPDGTRRIFTESASVGLDGKTYYAYGSSSPAGYSAFGAIGTAMANYVTTGFGLKKWLQEAKTLNGAEWGSTSPFIDFRLAEIYLNYAEAAIESGQGNAALAEKYLNDIRKRAAHTDVIPATIENILKERQVELAFEYKRY